MKFLMDTNVVSELRRRVPDRAVLAWFARVAQEDLYLSVLTLGELRQGIEALRRKDPVTASSIDSWRAELVEAFGDRIVTITAEIADRWGRLNVPDRVPTVDGLLAATVLEYNWTLVTRNVADVTRTGARIFNPFEPAD